MLLRFPVTLVAFLVLASPALGREIMVRQYLATASLEHYPQVEVEEIVPNFSYPMARTTFTLRDRLVTQTIKRIYRARLKRRASAREISFWKKELRKLRIGAVEGADLLTLSLRYREKAGASCRGLKRASSCRLQGVYFLTADNDERIERVIARRVVGYLAARIVRINQVAQR